VSVLTTDGANLPSGETRVEMRAVHDGQYVYFLFEWRDNTRSQKHLPLVKAAAGWRVSQVDFLRANEDVFYEDKFAVMLSNNNPLAAAQSVHLGKHPLSGQPGSSAGRGLHYTDDGSILDLWQWKSVRSNPHGQADDDFFGPPKLAPPQTPREFRKDRDGYFRRFTAGYKKDPPTTWNGYAMNWEVFQEGIVKPRRLPKNADDLDELDLRSLSPDVSDEGQWWMEWNDTKPYLKEHDHYTVGTIMPAVLIKTPLTGDRGDVEAKGGWKDGRWSLEMKRLLDTGSKYDIPMTDKTYLWVSVFDHTQTRHSRHLRPVRIRLE
jgi:hypothetical protein